MLGESGGTGCSRCGEYGGGVKQVAKAIVYLRAEFFLNVHGIRRDILTGKNEMAFVGNHPFDGLAFGELHGLSDR